MGLATHAGMHRGATAELEGGQSRKTSRARGGMTVAKSREQNSREPKAKSGSAPKDAPGGSVKEDRKTDALGRNAEQQWMRAATRNF